MDDFKGDEFVIGRIASSNEEQRGVTAVDYLRVCKTIQQSVLTSGEAGLPLYSRKLHILVRRASTSWETSLMILAFSLGESVVNHFASLY